MTTPLITLAVCGLVLLVSAVQRVAGFGFGLVMAPFLVVLLSPHEGVMLANVLSLIPPLLIMWELRVYIEWKKFLWMALGGVAIMPPAAWLSGQTSTGPLYIVVGAVVLAGLLASVLLARWRVHIDGAATQSLTGVAAGAGAVVAGVAAPPLSIYGMLSRWSLLPMIATMQPLWMVIATSAVTSKYLMGDGALPPLPWWGWAGAVAAIPLGVWIGQKVHRGVNETLVRRFVLFLAVIGAALALLTGVRMTFW